MTITVIIFILKYYKVNELSDIANFSVKLIHQALHAATSEFIQGLLNKCVKRIFSYY